MRTTTFGTMPSREEFDAACSLVDPDNGRSVDNDGFHFGKDPRLGTVTLGREELWREVQRAFADYGAGSEKAGDWLSGVMGCLGFEWV